jgi:hypothetical protein
MGGSQSAQEETPQGDTPTPSSIPNAAPGSRSRNIFLKKPTQNAPPASALTTGGRRRTRRKRSMKRRHRSHRHKRTWRHKRSHKRSH